MDFDEDEKLPAMEIGSICYGGPDDSSSTGCLAPSSSRKSSRSSRSRSRSRRPRSLPGYIDSNDTIAGADTTAGPSSTAANDGSLDQSWGGEQQSCSTSTRGLAANTYNNQDHTSNSAGVARSRKSSSLQAASQSSLSTISKDLTVLVRILFQYLERVDPSALGLAKEVLKDCERKHDSKDSKFRTLDEAINERIRNAVGEAHWLRAHRKKKRVVMALKLQGQKQSAQEHNQNSENQAVKRSLVNADITVPRRNQLRRVKKRKKSRSPSLGSGQSSENSDSSYTSTSSLTTSGNEKGFSTSSTAPSTSTNSNSNENTNSRERELHQESSSCSSGD